MLFETILSFIDTVSDQRIRGWMRLFRGQNDEQMVILLTEVEGEGHMPMAMYLDEVVEYILGHIALPPDELLFLLNNGSSSEPTTLLDVVLDDVGALNVERNPTLPDQIRRQIDEINSTQLWDEPDNGSWVCNVGQWRGVAIPRGAPLGSRWESHVFSQRRKLNHSGPAMPTALRARMWVLDIIANLSRETELWPGEATPTWWNERDDESWR